MTLLADVLDPAELAIAVEKGLVRTQRHPTRSPPAARSPRIRRCTPPRS
ncbi:hypothetical protein [Paractinoplanes globisporus]|uniref:Uncharacterized protein n=1 Tax=Paractinoplanes globisporus TaxID=113565 RepID=A0ABW6WK37_9ACTN|nr:hypothetical protein [Actinoplanes globisporus]